MSHCYETRCEGRDETYATGMFAFTTDPVPCLDVESTDEDNKHPL
ncbi:hypothetical protein [Haloferax sp. DFSO52]